MELKKYTGREVSLLIDTISSMRVRYFAEFPYLYESDAKTESEYMREFSKNEHAVTIVAYIEGAVAGIFTGLPLNCNSPITKSIPKNIFIDTNVFYLSELIVDENFRHRGISTILFKEIEKEAESMGYTAACFLTVSRPENHPQKPINYQDPSTIWKKNGYQMLANSVTHNWPTKNANQEIVDAGHAMDIWTKEFK